MPIKPSILKNVENILGEKKVETFIEEVKDCLYIEDLSGRLIIIGSYQNFKVEEFISGIPIAIKGQLNHEGIFIFDDFLFYNNIKGNIYENNIEEILKLENENDINDKILKEEKGEIINLNIGKEKENYDDLEDKIEEKRESDNISDIISIKEIKIENKNLILFISNLNLGNLSEYIKAIKPSIRTLLIDFIQNQNNISNILYQYSNQISRIILVGNSMNCFEAEIEKHNILNTNKNPISDIYNNILENYLLLNQFLKIISNYIYIDIMPSMHSYDDLKYPQSPLNKFLFTENIPNINLSTLKLVSNPYFFNIFIPSLNKTKYFIGTSGENIKAIKQYSCYENNLDIMKKQIEWKHLCPIDPGYLTLYSIDNKTDPLIINKIPDVYFTCGNKELSYEKNKINDKEIVFISLPDFDKTSKVVLFNYEDDTIKEIDFSFNFQVN